MHSCCLLESTYALARFAQIWQTAADRLFQVTMPFEGCSDLSCLHQLHSYVSDSLLHNIQDPLHMPKTLIAHQPIEYSDGHLMVLRAVISRLRGGDWMGSARC